MLGQLFGWHAWSAPMFNLALITLALLVYGLEARPSTKSCALAAAALASFWAFPLFLPTNMQEGLQFPGAFVLAALIRPAFRAPLGRGRTAGVVALMVGLSLVKPIWAMLWPALLVLLASHRSRRAQLLAFASGLGLLVASVLVYGGMMAPFRDQPVSFVKFFQMGDSLSSLGKTLRATCEWRSAPERESSSSSAP